MMDLDNEPTCIGCQGETKAGPLCLVGRKFVAPGSSSKVEPLPHWRSQMKANSIQRETEEGRKMERERERGKGG